MTDSFYERVGGVTFPLTVEQCEGRTFPDPARDALLEFFAAVIRIELGKNNGRPTTDSPWVHVAQATKLTSLSPVEDTFPALPTPQLMTERKGKYPALFLDRVGEPEDEEYSMSIDKRTQQWELTWVLGPLNIGEWKKFSAACKTIVPGLIERAIAHKGHPEYQGGTLQFGEGSPTHISAIRKMSHSADPVPFGGTDTLHYGVSIKLETIETDAALEDAFPEMGPAIWKIDSGSEDGSIKEFVVVESA